MPRNHPAHPPEFKAEATFLVEPTPPDGPRSILTSLHWVRLVRRHAGDAVQGEPTPQCGRMRPRRVAKASAVKVYWERRPRRLRSAIPSSRRYRNSVASAGAVPGHLGKLPASSA
jgi:hypothetical protein